ncbi:MAG: DUF1080 domain-containing protein [Bacteroidota bacterium]|nr:DUF1080 domain-containing protein [Bacteroidota bacterium]
MKKPLFTILALLAIQFSLSAQTRHLFDGKTTNGWHSYLKTGPGAWKVVDGTLQLDPQAPDPGDLVTMMNMKIMSFHWNGRLQKVVTAVLSSAFTKILL